MEYAELTNEAEYEVGELKIENLGFNEETLKFLKTQKPLSTSIINKRQFETVSDLLSVSRNQLKNYIQNDYVFQNKYTEILFDVEETLAILGLKLKESHFTAGEVRLTRLDVAPDLKEKLNKLFNANSTLDDVVNYGFSRLKNVGFDQYEITRLSIALEKFGLGIDGAKFTLNPQNFFPAPKNEDFSEGIKGKVLPNSTFLLLPPMQKKYASVAMLPIMPNSIAKLIGCGINTIGDYIDNRQNLERFVNATALETADQFLRDAGLEVEVPKIIPIEQCEGLPKEEILKMDIKSLGLHHRYLYGLYNDNIRTIGDLIKKESNFKQRVKSETYNTILKKLANVDIKFEGEEKKLVDGDFSKVNKMLRCLLQKAPKQFDYNELSPEEKRQFCSVCVENFGFADDFCKELCGHFKTMGDIINCDHEYIEKNLSKGAVRALKKALMYYNIELGDEINLPPKNSGRYVKCGIDVDFEKLSDEEKQEFLNLPLSEIGFGEDLANTLFNTFEVTTLAELLKIGRKKVRYALPSNSMLIINKILRQYKLKFESNEENGQPKEMVKRKLRLPLTKKEMIELDRQAKLRNVMPIHAKITANQLYENLCKYGLSALYDVDARDFNDPQNLAIIEKALNMYFAGRIENLVEGGNKEIAWQNYISIKDEEEKAYGFIKSIRLAASQQMESGLGEDEPEL